MAEAKLERTLGPITLWGLGVGYVISGMYFGWNLGLPEGGTLGLAISTALVIVMYVFFTFSYTELACAIPRAGGAFDYALRAMGPKIGLLAGTAQLIEFVFAPPAIAAAIGAYFHQLFPHVPMLTLSIGAYLIFTALNIYGVKAAARFELFITILAVLELLLFAGLTLPHFEWKNLQQNALPNGLTGVFASVPFALWFFLAIEGVANVAEEVKNPQRNVVLGFGSALMTLVFLCVLTFVSSIGVGGWEQIVWATPGSPPSDSPLPLALGAVVGQGHLLYHLLVTVGLFGLVASFHGIILAGGRASYEMGRVGFLPRFLGKIHGRFKTPAHALLVNMSLGILALLTGKTGQIITLACFGALALYILSLISFFILRKKRPQLERPFVAPFYPWAPALALVLACGCLVAMTYYNLAIGLLFFSIMFLSLIVYLLRKKILGQIHHEEVEELWSTQF